MTSLFEFRCYLHLYTFAEFGHDDEYRDEFVLGVRTNDISEVLN